MGTKELRLFQVSQNKQGRDFLRKKLLFLYPPSLLLFILEKKIFQHIYFLDLLLFLAV
jgi:hypothetical protein